MMADYAPVSQGNGETSNEPVVAPAEYPVETGISPGNDSANLLGTASGDATNDSDGETLVGEAGPDNDDIDLDGDTLVDDDDANGLEGDTLVGNHIDIDAHGDQNDLEGDTLVGDHIHVAAHGDENDLEGDTLVRDHFEVSDHHDDNELDGQTIAYNDPFHSNASDDSDGEFFNAISSHYFSAPSSPLPPWTLGRIGLRSPSDEEDMAQPAATVVQHGLERLTSSATTTEGTISPSSSTGAVAQHSSATNTPPDVHQFPSTPNFSYAELTSLTPCELYLRGGCSRPDCPFAHVPDVEESHTQLPDPSVPWSTWPVGGALVSFTDGAQISELQHQASYAAIRISNIPNIVNASVLIAPLLLAGHNVRSADVRFYLDPFVSDHQMAVITAPISGLLALAQHFMPQTYRIGAARPLLPFELARRQYGAEVHCTWDIPSRVVWIAFTTLTRALDARSGFESGDITMFGDPVSPELLSLRGVETGDPFTNNYLVVLVVRDVADHLEEEDVHDSIPDTLWPIDVWLSERTDHDDIDRADRAVLRMLNTSGTVLWIEMATLPGNQRRAIVQYLHQHQASRLVQQYRGLDLTYTNDPDYPPLNMSLRHLCWTKLLVPIVRYHTASRFINANIPHWAHQCIRYTASPGRLGHISLRLCGPDTTDLLTATTTLSACLDGTLQEYYPPGRLLWHPAFAHSVNTYLEMESISARFGVLITVNPAAETIRVLAPNIYARGAAGSALEMLGMDIFTWAAGLTLTNSPEVDEVMVTLPCGHVLERNAMKAHVILSAPPLRCPFCPRLLPMGTVQSLLAPPAFRQLLRRVILASRPEQRGCPTEGCGGALPEDVRSGEYTCSFCGKTMCARCLTLGTERSCPLRTEEVPQMKKVKCTRCRSEVESQGRVLTQCGRCLTWMCWACGKIFGGYRGLGHHEYLECLEG